MKVDQKQQRFSFFVFSAIERALVFGFADRAIQFFFFYTTDIETVSQEEMACFR